jgi:hypothetical protein
MTLLRRGGDEDPYLLRGLLVCELCDGPMVPVLVDTGVIHERHYGCQGGQCPRPYILAEAVEAAVWARFTELNRAFAETVLPNKRRAAIRPVLRNVWLGKSLGELRYEWHD